MVFILFVPSSIVHPPAEKAEHHYYLKIYRRGVVAPFQPDPGLLVN
jgi:hypothetical protein